MNTTMKWTIYVLAFMLGGAIAIFFREAEASEDVYLQDATALYEFRDIFNDGILMYRSKRGKNKEGLSIINLDNSSLMLIKQGPPRNCLELVLILEDPRVKPFFITCVKDILIKPKPVKHNAYGEEEEVDQGD